VVVPGVVTAVDEGPVGSMVGEGPIVETVIGILVDVSRAVVVAQSDRISPTHMIRFEHSVIQAWSPLQGKAQALNVGQTVKVHEGGI
jgi:hypothetical protein